MRLFAVAMALAAALACVPGDCDYDRHYEDGYALGTLCVDWITIWHEEDGECAAVALGDGYNAARADSGSDCGLTAGDDDQP